MQDKCARLQRDSSLLRITMKSSKKDLLKVSKKLRLEIQAADKHKWVPLLERIYMISLSSN